MEKLSFQKIIRVSVFIVRYSCTLIQRADLPKKVARVMRLDRSSSLYIYIHVRGGDGG